MADHARRLASSEETGGDDETMEGGNSGDVDSDDDAPANSDDDPDDEGDEVHGVVIGVTEEEVEVDFNHPLAGIDLHFSVQVMSREAE